MLKIEFEYHNTKIIIPAICEEKMRQVCSKFTQKTQINPEQIYFMYSGNMINLDLSVDQMISQKDKLSKMMPIIVMDYPYESEKNNKTISPYIICPICKEPARYELKDYRIRIYNCKNGHNIDNILLKDFENTQTIDESLIICDNCKIKNRANILNKEMYVCNICKMNLCPSCKSNHNKNHKLINYGQKDCVCDIHNKEYSSYCETCNTDICEQCENEHIEHEIISFKEIFPENMLDKNQIRAWLNSHLKAFRTKIGMIIDRLNDFLKNMEIYFKIIERNLDNYHHSNINYNILQNINYNFKDGYPNFGELTDEYTLIGLDLTYKDFIPRILKIYNGMNNNEIDLIYNIINNEKEIKIFGDDFVTNNKNLCKILYNNKEYALTSKFVIHSNEDNILKIKLKGINNITNLNSMFEGCSQLSNLSNLSSLDTTFVIRMGSVFKNCKCLELPDISNWNTSNVEFMFSVFEGCSSLKSLPDISNWNTSNVRVMSLMFSDCSSLKSLPDISNWNTSSVGIFNYMFKGCSSLKSLPDISKWDINFGLNCKNVNGGLTGMFDGCPETLNIPEKFKNVE